MGKVKVTGWGALCEVPMQLLMEVLGLDSNSTANNEAELVVESAESLTLARPGGGLGKSSGLVAPPGHRVQARRTRRSPPEEASVASCGTTRSAL